MNQMVRNVIARYYANPQDALRPEKKVSWMDYVEEKNKGIAADPDNPVYDMLKGKTELDLSFNTTNPYDKDSPSDSPKDQEDSLPFVNDPIYPSNIVTINRPNNYGEGHSLHNWWDVREEDWTEDEQEQNPAMSLTNKYSAETVPIELLSRIIVSGDNFYEFMMRSKVAATLDEIIAKDFHYKNDLKLQRASRCQVIWANKNNPNQYERGLFTFRVSSPGSKEGPHNVYMQFLRDENKPADKYEDYPVHIGCTCKSFLFSGAQYYAVKDGYMYMPAFKPDLVGPRPQNQYTVSVSPRYPKGKRNPGRGLNSRVCKHILAVFDEVKNTPIEVHYKKYPISSPPSKIMNKDVWKDLMKFPFTEDEVKKRLMSSYPKVPAYFNRESVTPAVIDWFYNTWFPRTDDEKLKSLKEFAMYPERVFFILIEEAYLKRKQGEHISKRLVDEGYDMMADIVQPDNDLEPQLTPENENEPEGTGKIDMPGTKPPEDIEEEETEKPITLNYKTPSKKVKSPNKIKKPDKIKSPSSVQPAIK